jgi:uridine kinase
MPDRIEKVIKRDGSIVSFDKNKISQAVFRAIVETEKVTPNQTVLREIMKVKAEKITELVLEKILKEYLKKEEHPVYIETIQDCVESTLIEEWMIETGEAYMLYREGRAKLRNKEITPEQFSPHGINMKKFKEVYLWNIEHECDTIPKLNEWVLGVGGKKFSELVKLSQEQYEKQLDKVASLLLEKNDIRIVIVAGPSSSGKTTTTKKIEDRLKKKGFSFKTLNLDNYFYDIDEQPKDQFGDVDYETPDALNYPLINEHLEKLIKGETIYSPYYNFKTGKSEPNKIKIELSSNEILLLDCLHGLYPKMTQSVSDKQKFKLYIEQMNVLKDVENHFTRWTDVRMLRRMLRDSVHRNHDMNKTLGHWHYVRKGELKYIIPYINTVDYIVNGGLAYELPVLKAAIGDKFPDYHIFKQQNRMDAYVRGVRVKMLLDTIEVYNDLNVVPLDSHLREFIGGSIYEIPHND